jgi:NADPH:quinone reductase-like Zn-dependent oxidoreductase
VALAVNVFYFTEQASQDLLIALGVLDNSTSEMGLEGSGIVRAVGSGVTHLSVGDRVAYMSSGCFATHKAVPAVSCVKLNTSMSFEQGAAIPCVYATTILALVDKANLREGQVGESIRSSLT